MSATLDTEQTGMGTGLIRRAGGRYSSRRVIPLDLQAHYGRREIVRALGTADPAEAKLRHARMWVTLNDEFDKARRELAVRPPASIPKSVQPHAVETMSEEEFAFHQEQEEFGNADLTRIEREQEEREGVRRQLEARLSATNADLSPQELAMQDIVRDQKFEAAVARERLVMKSLETPKTAQIAAPSPSPAKDGKETKLSVVVQRWAAERKPIPRTVWRTEEIVSRFERVIGNLPVEAITRQHVLDFKDKMVASGQTSANTNALLRMLNIVLNYAANNNLIPINPASKIRVQDKRLAKAKRTFFDEVALKSIFGSPIYTQGDRPLAGGGEASYWLPLLALYTGARLEELGQLAPDDIQQETYRDGDAQKSAWVIRITENSERGQRLKNEGSKRRVPIHKDLITLGFLDLAKEAQAAKRKRIFYQLRPANDGKITGNFSKWFGRYRRSTLGLKGLDTPFHSFRHSFRYYGQYSDISDAKLRAIMGHEAGDSTDGYNAMNYPLPPLVEAMDQYKIPGFTLPPPPKR